MFSGNSHTQHKGAHERPHPSHKRPEKATASTINDSQYRHRPDCQQAKTARFGPTPGSANANNGNPTGQPPAPPGQGNSGIEADSTPPADCDCGKESDEITPSEGNSNEIDNTPGIANDGSQTAFQQNLSPPDTDIEPPAKNQDVQATRPRTQLPPLERIEQPAIVSPSRNVPKRFNRPVDRIRTRVHRETDPVRNPLRRVQPPLVPPSRNVPKRFNRPLKRRSNNFHHFSNRRLSPNRRRVERNTASTIGSDDHGDDNRNDGDDELDSPSSASPDTEQPATPSPTNPTIASTEQPPPTSSRPIARSQAKTSTTSLASPGSSATPSPKCKRSPSFSTPPSPTITQGDRASKCLRNSVSGSSPLPDPLDLKRTRGEQKRFEEKVGTDHVFDQQHPGSVRRETIDAKSGAKEWERETLHQEPWDGSKGKE